MLGWFFLSLLVFMATFLRANDQPIAHWKLETDAEDSASEMHHAINHGVRFENGAAVFNGRDSWLEV
ncbi:MAG: hypothetical protein KDA84_29435, partial [Planctomycetaceae bacterium]|nr:hypothetical protein [Planctomycetaceae bacterium]